MDGVNLDRLQPGTVREVSAAIASWLIVEGYAEPEMRRQPEPEEFSSWPAHRDSKSLNGSNGHGTKRRITDA
jgi:hypothetical protein